MSPSPSHRTSDMDFKSIHLAPNPCRYQVQVVIISHLDHCKRSLNPSSCFILLCQTQGSLRPRAGDGVFTSLSGLRYYSSATDLQWRPSRAWSPEQEPVTSCSHSCYLYQLIGCNFRFRASHHSYTGLLSLPEFSKSRTSACTYSSSSHSAWHSHTHRSGQFCTDVLTSWAEPQKADVSLQIGNSGLLAWLQLFSLRLSYGRGAVSLPASHWASRW